MNVSVGKFAPVLVVLLVVSYLCWTEWSMMPGVEPPQPELKQDVTLAMLSTPSVSPPERSPFDKPANETPAIGKTPNETKSAAAQVERAPVEETPPEPEPVVLPGKIQLRGALLSGDRRVAMINDNVYAEGDLVPLDGETNVLISQIHDHKVVVIHHGQRFELNYVDQTPKKNVTTRGDTTPGTNHAGRARTDRSRANAQAFETPATASPGLPQNESDRSPSR